jgi:molybdate transport system substrate-binding protein
MSLTFAPRRPLLRGLAAAILCGTLIATAGAQTSLKVLTAGAFKQVVVALVPAFEARTGLRVELQNDTAGGLVKRIQGGEAFDVVIVTMPALATLSDQGRVDRTSVTPVAKVGIGVAVQAGAPHPPLQTVEQFKDAVLKARKVAYIDPAAGGSSGIYLDGLFQRLGIADAVRAKAVLVPGGLSAERVVSGEAELAIQQISELLPVAGVSVVGPLPDEIQNYTTYGAAVSAQSAARQAAASFVEALATADATAVIRSKGMMPAR